MIGLSIALVLHFLIVGTCGFCHAPEHAYDELNEHPDFNCDGLCPDAQECPLMARTSYPDKPEVVYELGQVTHA